MRSFSLLAISLVSAAAIATAAQGTIYTDSTFDLFDNGLDNLDISQVDINDDGTNLSIAITTRGFQTWTKYMVFFNTSNAGTSTNAWSRPVILTSNIDHFVGSWVDASTTNSQFVSWTGSAWNWGQRVDTFELGQRKHRHLVLFARLAWTQRWPDVLLRCRHFGRRQ